MSIVIVPSGPSAAWMAPAPTTLPANRLRLRTYSLCLACFFALISTSLPRLALFAPAYERLDAVPMLDRTLNVRAAPPALALVGIFEPAAGREIDDTEGAVDVDAAAAARCAPSLAITREREMRGLRGGCCVLVDARSGLVVERARAAAAAASEVGRTGGATASSGVLNILLACPPRGLFVIASRAELRGGGVLARCATMLLVLDLTTAPVAVGLRVFARELAVGANSLEGGLNIVAVA